ncbi:MAG: YaaA family protein [Rhodothermales bacterium]
MSKISILLPPSEGKKSGGNPFAPDMFDYRSSSTFNYFSDLNPERRKLINVLQETIEKGEDLESLFGVKGDNLEEALDSNLTIFKAPLMSALDRYSPGIMYKSMDFAGLPTGAQRRLLENAIIFSGLFGLLRPDDLIPNYKLKIDASLPEMGKVSKYWRTYVSPLLNETLADHVVWNLLPKAHRDVWEDAHTYKQMVEVSFYDEVNGEMKALTHGVKPLRGQLVNYLVREMVEDIEGVMEWEHPAGYKYDKSRSVFDEENKTVNLAMVKS